MTRATRLFVCWVAVLLASLLFGAWQRSWLAGGFMLLVLALQIWLVLLSQPPWK